MTRPNTPLSSADAIEYASIGWPLNGRTFLPGTRLDPCRAGMKATADGELVLTSGFPGPGSRSGSAFDQLLRATPNGTSNANREPNPEHEPGTENPEARTIQIAFGLW